MRHLKQTYIEGHILHIQLGNKNHTQSNNDAHARQRWLEFVSLKVLNSTPPNTLGTPVFAASDTRRLSPFVFHTLQKVATGRKYDCAL